MITYKINLYDLVLRKTSTIAEMPERRIDPKRLKEKPTVINWLKCTYGKEWYSQNKNLIGISEHNGRKLER